jgi:DHA1 family inner membrane transport protein
MDNPSQRDELSEDSNKKASTQKGIIGSLTLANFSTNMMDFLVSLFLVDIAFTFFHSTSPGSVALVSQLITISNLVSVAVGLSISALCLRFRFKSLLMAGLLCISLGAVGCFSASNFFFLQIVYSFDGIGTILVGAMAYTLAGELVDLEKRGRAIGWVIAGSSLSGLVGSIVINSFFGDVLGWKGFMLLYVLPISLFAFALVYFYVPSRQNSSTLFDKQRFKVSFKQVFARQTSTACLIGNLVRYTGGIWQIFAVAFIRTKFDLPITTGATMILFGMIGLVFGMVLAGYLVNRVGRKRLLVLSTLGVCGVILPIVFVPEVWMAIFLYMLGGLVGGLSFSTDINFTLEQTPRARGTMMSINSAFVYLGSAIGAALGGFVLALFGYEILAFTLVGLDFTAALIFAFFTKEPCKK